MIRGICRHLGASALLVIAAASCGGEIEFESAPGGDTSKAGVNPLLPLLELSEDSLWGTPYQGTRLIESRFFEDGQEVTLSYREAVAADGAGNFSVDLVEVLSFLPDPTLFQATQDTREGFLYRYRDFQLRDLFIFFQSYVAVDQGQDVVVAGRTCKEVRILPDSGSGTYYDLALDAETGLVLRSVEIDPAGIEVHRMEFETFDPNPDLTGAEWFQPTNLETVLDRTGDLDSQAGFDVLVPLVLPDGYQLWKAATLTDEQGDTWAKLTYTDGVEPLFLLHRDGASQVLSSPAGPAATVEVKTDSLWSYPIGPVQVVEGRLRGVEIIALGKVDSDTLLDVLESAIH